MDVNEPQAKIKIINLLGNSTKLRGNPKKIHKINFQLENLKNLLLGLKKL